MGERHSSSTPITALLSVMLAGTSAAWVVIGARAPLRTVGFTPWVGLLLMCYACERLAVTVEIRGDTYENNLGVLALALGLVVVSPLALLTARIAGTALVAVARRRVEPLKVVFNATNRALETAVAILVVRGLSHGWGTPLSLRTTAAMLLAVLVAEALTATTVNAAIAFTVGRLQFSAWQASVSGGFAIAEAALALLTLHLLWTDWRGLWLVVVLTVGVWALYRAYVRVRSRYAQLELLYRFTDSLAGVTETIDVTHRTLELACELLRAEQAEMIFVTDKGPIAHRFDVASGHTTTSYPADGPRTILQVLLEGGTPVLINGLRNHRLHAYALAHGWSDVAAVSLSGPSDSAGVLAVANRLGNVSAFDVEDLRLLKTFARSSAIAHRVGGLVNALRDEAAERTYRADHDALTGLANRSLLNRTVEESLAQAGPDEQVALIFMDLDGFKEVNDALGHHTGDALLIETAERLDRVTSGRAVVARLGGDEFAIVLTGTTPDAARELARQACDAIEEPVRLGNLALQVHVSAGIALVPSDAEDTTTLFQRADVAMYLAKARQTGIERYDHAVDRSGTRRLTIGNDLERSLRSGDLELHYQPQLDLRTARVIGVEALARWTHPIYGRVPPDEFIPIAEQSGLMPLLTRWALEAGLADLARWRSLGHTSLTVSVNISARDLSDASLTTFVATALVRHGLPASALTIELTESTVMADPRRSLTVLQQLHEQGIRLAIDDYGAGYSSLAYLKRLPVDELKIDRSFVSSMCADLDDQIIVKSTIDLAHNLGLVTVAEGVEDEATQRLVASLGGDAIQGYHLARPLPADHMTEWLEQHDTRRAGEHLLLDAQPAR